MLQSILPQMWGGQFCPQPPFRRLSRAIRVASESSSAG
jgi:hypothetical protein